MTAISAQTFGPADPSCYEDAEEMPEEEFAELIESWEAESTGQNWVETASSMPVMHGAARVIISINGALQSESGHEGQEGMVVRRDPGELIGSGRRYIPPANKFFA
ncbi:hypothetical protein [Bordetella sp. LUAb4]|uniref:hypothetical protein n=1 Tax=Bordetella sp. LUAb4 TaxID=2843195 RepID=UPI001E3B05CD|nr:hypothetical protein [Bordetella sp. LUAb4]